MLVCGRHGHRSDCRGLHRIPGFPDHPWSRSHPLDSEADRGSEHGREAGDGVGQLGTQHYCQPIGS